ncbi:FAD binding domain-containing protein [Methylobrevis pamukkalensis]|uniref:6-hydroxypseudooxynicotine dehydrogenase complex subunit alpha n=1 Tax=Methylobrevis pamukkalensis TaxID=1439726 RepID=A0A1E3H7P8_9HYPH|nr:xanthine dehydrogenase family protein subunit M [Methylobrevis pamukkalensis]ODN72324.1 6-hydroxypseudooxynicotine dehydrogenase complex subunit alpha [Methylobrevis pamukkalensis]
MKPAAFAYLAPTTLAEALEMIDRIGDDGKILAGGQSLVPAMNFRLARPGTLVDINGVAGLSGISGDSARGISIGALTRHAAFHTPPFSGPLADLLAKVVRNIAHYPIRQRGTFGGSLSHADPASEWCLVTATLGATLHIASLTGTREVAAADFFRGTFTTALQPSEILVRIDLPPLGAGWGTGFYEFSRRKGDFALAMALTALRIEGGTIREARLGVGGVADRALRLAKTEAFLVGQPAHAETFAAAAAMAQDSIDVSEDIHAGADYRRDLLGTVIRRALAEAAA